MKDTRGGNQVIEQSVENGAVYLSYIRKSMLISESVKVSDIQFGRWRAIRIVPEDNFIYVTDVNENMTYLYESGVLQVRSESLMGPEDGAFYYYGVAKHKDKRTGTYIAYPYYIKNKPPVTLDIVPKMNLFELPRTMQDLGYNLKFEYNPLLLDLLENIPATYVDRFKRPIVFYGSSAYPVNIDNVKTTVKDLPPINYPIVVNLSNTPFAVVDLEPGYTEEDLNHFNSLKGYYLEETPRGGKHLLVHLDEPVYKYRYSDHLEIINNGMVTLYGINSKMMYANPKPIDTTPYSQTNRSVSTVVQDPVSEDVQEYVKVLEAQRIKTASSNIERILFTHQQNEDKSHADYIALYSLYMRDVYPYRASLPTEDLPWILEAYARDIIPHRDKHETRRNGVPYMVYLSDKVIQYVEEKNRKVESL